MNSSFRLSLPLKAIGVEISEVIHKRLLFNGKHHCSAPFPGGLHGSLRFPGAMVAYQLYYTALPSASTCTAPFLRMLAHFRFQILPVTDVTHTHRLEVYIRFHRI